MMEITPEAKTQLEELIKQDDGNCLVALVKKSCCGEALVFQVGNRDLSEATMIEGIPFIMEDQAEELCKSKIIKVKSGDLYIEDK